MNRINICFALMAFTSVCASAGEAQWKKSVPITLQIEVNSDNAGIIDELVRIDGKNRFRFERLFYFYGTIKLEGASCIDWVKGEFQKNVAQIIMPVTEQTKRAAVEVKTYQPTTVPLAVIQRYLHVQHVSDEVLTGIFAYLSKNYRRCELKDPTAVSVFEDEQSFDAATPTPVTLTPQTEPIKRPVAKVGPKFGLVISPFPPHSVLDVSDLKPGGYAKDPTSGKIFVVPPR